MLVGGVVAGTISKFEIDRAPEVSYWLGREYWGRGIATAALPTFLHIVTQRPLFARAPKDHSASIRVLEKCGFRIIGDERGFANARNEDIDEVILRLDAGESA
ncbi:MAG: hypothetical protein NVS2B17_09450 [Candidatus Velthaea sp.]